VSESEIDHERLTCIFDRASELDGEARDKYLSQSCGDDRRMRDEVESLLRSSRELPPALATGGLTDRVNESLSRVPDAIGPYRVIERIGEGGMGEVFRARQSEPVEREVAVKLIRRGFESRALIQRFEAERQTLAMMSHPCIAQVFDAGVTEDARPYIVMEYVDGEPFHEYCDRLQLSIDARLRLFVDVCRGIQHAHQKTVIHRDLKPTNVLVTSRGGQPIPKIIDFGVAKALAPTSAVSEITRHDQMIGTPAYMSPEQAESGEAQVDTRSDVYSLGVMLFELLTGSQPYDLTTTGSDSPENLRRVIREQRPHRPTSRLEHASDAEHLAELRSTERRALLRRLRGDLDWIVLRALEKDPAQRYPSALALADDILAFLADDPVWAGPPSRIYRARKFAQKHRVGVTLGSVLALALIALSVTMTVQNNHINSARARADDAAATAIRKAEAARSASDSLVQMFSFSPDPHEARSQLDAARRQIDRDFAGRPAEHGRLTYPLGQIYDRLGFEEGRPLMLEAMQEMEQALGLDDTEVLAARHDRAIYLARRKELDEALTILTDVVDRRRERFGPHATDTLMARVHLGRMLEMDGQFDQARVHLESVYAAARETRGDDDRITLLSMGYLGNLYLRNRNLDEAERWFSEASDRMLSALGPAHDHRLACLYKLGSIAALRGQTGRAMELILEALEGGDRPSWFDSPPMATHLSLLEEPNLTALHTVPEFMDLVGPDGYLVPLDLARSLARERKLDAALNALRLSVERGLPDAVELERDERLLPLHTQEEFWQIVARRSAGAVAATEPQRLSPGI